MDVILWAVAGWLATAFLIYLVVILADKKEEDD